MSNVVKYITVKESAVKRVGVGGSTYSFMCPICDSRTMFEVDLFNDTMKVIPNCSCSFEVRRGLNGGYLVMAIKHKEEVKP